MTKLPSAGSFWTEEVVKTPRALAEISQEDMFVAFVRHIAGDWGELDEFDWRVNDDALEYGSRVVSQYRSCRGIPFLIRTEDDPSVTIIMLLGEVLQ